jgi:hypothetical protein
MHFILLKSQKLADLPVDKWQEIFLSVIPSNTTDIQRGKTLTGKISCETSGVKCNAKLSSLHFIYSLTILAKVLFKWDTCYTTARFLITAVGVGTYRKNSCDTGSKLCRMHY